MTMAAIFLFTTILQILVYLSASQRNRILKMCVDIRPPLHSNIQIAEDNSYYVVQCETDYTVIGKNFVRCIDGEWDSLPPKCIKDNTRVCPELSTPENGTKVCEDGPLVPGKACRFSCSDGFEISGYNLRRCMFNFRWSRRDPKCNPIQIRLRPIYSITSCLENNGGCQHICMMERNEKKCACEEGYTLDVDQLRCNVRIRPIYLITSCLENNGGCQHVCMMERNEKKCACEEGYTLDVDQLSCNDINECAVQSQNKCQHDCVNTNGNYTCSCRAGYVQTDDFKCYDINECAIESLNKCQHDCVNTEGGYQCSCRAGYVKTDLFKCDDINECAVESLNKCQQDCVNTNGSYTCSCRAGYVKKDDFKCDDISECTIDSLKKCQHDCINTEGGYTCSCHSGYVKRDVFKCDDVNECIYANFGCSHTCVNTPGGAYCSCPFGYIIDADNKTCIVIQCPRLPIPHNSTMICKKDGEPLEVLENYHAGSVCIISCNSGFKRSASSNKVECQDDGTWKGSLPECKSKLQCPPDITVELLPGKSTHSVVIPEPVTNMTNIKVKPKWISIGRPLDFTSGKTNVILITMDLDTNRRVWCTMNVNVIDKEPPVFEYCPDSIEIKDASADGVLIDWEEPLVIDNIQVESLDSTLKPNTTFTPGSYIVQYIARDAAGNIASCSFDINVVLECQLDTTWSATTKTCEQSK